MVDGGDGLALVGGGVVVRSPEGSTPPHPTRRREAAVITDMNAALAGFMSPDYGRTAWRHYVLGTAR
jgi:hypothetical protein